MDLDIVAAMIFSLVVLLVIGGFILVYPLTRQVGKLLEQRIDEKRGGTLAAGDLVKLQNSIHALVEQVEQLAERQEFVESMLERREPTALPRPGASSRSRD